MTKIFFTLALFLSLSVLAQESVTPSEDVMFDPTSEIDEPIPTVDGTVDTVTPEATPVDAVVSEPVAPVTEEAIVPAEEPAMTEATPAPPKESIPVAETPNVVPAEEASPIVLNNPQTETPLMSSEIIDDEKKFNPLESHWLTTFGFEGLKYPVEWDFQGVNKNFKAGEQELWGGRIGVGGELHLGGGIRTATKVEGFYVGTLFSEVLNGGDEDEEVKFAFTKKTAQMFGVEATQSLSFIFDMKTMNPFMEEWTYLTVEPFIEAGIGTAKAYNRVNYKYDLDITEAYRLKVEDNLLSAKLAIGVNFISSTGYFLFLKATQTRYEITDREAKELRRNSGDTSDTITELDLDDKIDPITVYAIGGGYKF